MPAATLERGDIIVDQQTHERFEYVGPSAPGHIVLRELKERGRWPIIAPCPEGSDVIVVVP